MEKTKKVTFYINNEAYTINIGTDPKGILEKELLSFLPLNKNINTKELLTAFIQQSHKLTQYNEKLEKLSEKILQG